MARYVLPGQGMPINCRCVMPPDQEYYDRVAAFGVSEIEAVTCQLEAAVLVGSDEKRIDELLDRYNSLKGVVQ